ncbi:MAG: Fic family protein [Bdellovibrionota bacterium]
MNENIIKRIESKKKLLDSKRPLPKVILNRLKIELSLEWTYNSNAIEGNTLSLQETRLVLEEGLTIKGKKLREHFEAKNHEKAIHYIEKLVKPKYKLSEKDIFEVHRLVLENIEDEFCGRYRNGQVRILGANFVPPNHLKIKNQICELISSVNTNPSNLSFLELISRFHHKFVWIHPFFDGNGRTARLLMNLLFMKYGYPPAIILKNDRKKYYKALNEANNDEYESLILLIAQSLERSLDLYLSSIGVIKEDEYVPLSKLANKFPYSQEYLSLLARQGKIDAYKDSRNWLSTEKAIRDYIKSISKQVR